jgi:crotonobetainyl-CoA:carnitine CoA-transferase CaiB-like acyl-CoA transferase
MAGFMELTGCVDGPPMLSGVPLIDLKAGDEVYANVCLALAEKAETGRGQAIHVSMMQAASSWLITTLPLLDFDCDASEVTRCGNEHRKFIPVNVYPTADGFLLIAIGNDVQWERLTRLPKFLTLANEVRVTNAGRHAERSAIHRDMANVTRQYLNVDLTRELRTHKIPCAPIQTVAQVRDTMADKLTTTRTPDGKIVRLPPLPVDRDDAVVDYGFAPSYNQDTESILRQIGLADEEVHQLQTERVIP